MNTIHTGGLSDSHAAFFAAVEVVLKKHPASLSIEELTKQIETVSHSFYKHLRVDQYQKFTNS